MLTFKIKFRRVFSLAGTFSLLLLFFVGCKKIDRDNTYEVNPIDLYPSSADKKKQKTNEQYVAILHANLFQKALSANEIYEISQLMYSIGDQEFARRVVISNFFNKTGVILPTKKEMTQDIDLFIKETYHRFLVRDPSEGEKTYFRNYLTARTTPTDTISPELVYFSFALSDEYMFY